MGKEKPATIGHIDCPTCGMSYGMAIKRDKNGDAFGFCEDCAQQLFTRNVFKSKLLLQRMRPVTAPTAPEPVTEPTPATAPAAPEGAGAAKPAAPAPTSTKPEKTPPAAVPADQAAEKQARASWWSPVMGKTARKAA